MKKLLFLLGLLAIGQPAIARLGENAEELVTRYGPVVETIANIKKPEFPGYSFRVDDVKIVVRFLDGVSGGGSIWPR